MTVAVPTRSTVLPLPFATLMVMTVRLALLDVVAVFSSGCRKGGVSDLDDVDLEAGEGDQAAVVGILTMLGSMPSAPRHSAVGSGSTKLISLAAVVTFFGLALSDAPGGEYRGANTLHWRLYEGIAFSAYFRWMRACDGAVA